MQVADLSAEVKVHQEGKTGILFCLQLCLSSLYQLIQNLFQLWITAEVIVTARFLQIVCFTNESHEVCLYAEKKRFMWLVATFQHNSFPARSIQLRFPPLLKQGTFCIPKHQNGEELDVSKSA